MATRKKTETETEVEIMNIETGRFTCCVLGMTPMLMHSFSGESVESLLFPKGKKTAAERESAPKHFPRDEFRGSLYMQDVGDTLLYLPPTAFKNGICNAAVDHESTKLRKAQLARLLWVCGQRIDVYGIPKLHMAPVRNADMNRTPDIRTRAVIEKWCARVTVEYIKPLVKERVLLNLLAFAGLTQGIGDNRNEKGKGTNGQYQPITEDDPEFQLLVKTAGRSAQIRAVEDAAPYDNYSNKLLEYWDSEIKRRGFEIIDGKLKAPQKARSRKRTAKAA